MADVKITDLAPGTFLSGTELFESVQNGQSVRLTAEQIAAYVQSDVFGSVIEVSQGGTGSQSLNGYLIGGGVTPIQGVEQIPAADVSGLGTAALVNLSVGTVAPSSPAVGDLWVDTN